jgi:hypothetical protein
MLFLSMEQEPLVGQGPLIIEASDYTLWTSDQPDAEPYIW